MEYVPIRVSTLRGDLSIDFDAYIKIGEKFILYVRKGDSFEGARLERLKEKKLRKMFIQPDQEDLYRNYLTRNIERAYDGASGASLQNRAEIVQGAQQSNIEEVMENPDDVSAYNEAKEAAAKFVKFIFQEDRAFAHILNIHNADQNIAHHGVTVSTLAICLAKKLSILDPTVTQMLTLGSLLHDFGHYNSPVNLARPLKDFSPAELAAYKTHPSQGAESLKNKKHFDTTVLTIIAEHEEFIDGKGFPRGLTESKLDPLSVITATANALDRLVTFEGVPKKEAAKKLMITAVGRHPLNHIQILGDLMSKL